MSLGAARSDALKPARSATVLRLKVGHHQVEELRERWFAKALCRVHKLNGRLLLSGDLPVRRSFSGSEDGVPQLR